MPHYLEGTSSPEDDGSYSLNSEESFNELRRLTEMGDDYDDRFRKTGDLSDANQMIECFEKALELLSDNHPAISNYLERLGRSFMHRFEHSGNLSDIETAVEYEREAISLCSSEDSDRPRFLNSLGFCLLRRFERLGNLCDIDEAIKLQLGALLGLRETDLMKPIICRSLCLSYTSRFDQLGDLADIDKAIDFQQRALSESDKDAMGLEHLGLAFMRRFVRLGDLTDINRAIECQQEAISLMTDENSLGPREFNSLGLSFMRRFEHLGNISDINQAVDALERSILLAKSGATDKPTFLNNLGMACMRRFERLGNLEDISRAIECQEKALSLSPADHALRPTFANNLAISFMRRFERLGDLPDIDNTISWLQQAVPTEPSSHALGPTFINNLGLAFMLRFGLLGDLADINEAIDRQHVAISFTPGDHAEKPRFFSNLGRSFMRRFGSLGDLGDVDDAIRCQLQAISLAPSTHSLRHAFFDNLGSCFISRFEISNDLEDVNKAIEYQQQGVLLTPTGHAQRPSHLSNFGKSMRCRYEHLRKIEDISEAIKWEEEAVILAPEEHYNKPEFLCDLGHSFSSRFWHSEDLSDFNQAIESFQKAAKSPAGPAIVRFNAARSWAKLYAQQYQSTVLDAYELAMSLVPRIVWMGTTVRHRYQNTALIGDFVVEAAAAAIASRKYPQALEWLEEGRSIVWGQRLKLRTPVDQLRAVDAELADRLELVGKELETVSVSKPDGEKATLEEAAQRHHRLAEEWETLVKAVRKLHGFDDFLLPKRAKELMAATKQGVIIVVNIHLARCDALIMSSRSEEVIHVPLEEFTYRKAAKASSDWTRSLKICGVRDRGGFMSKSSVLVQAQFIPILAMLWVEVVKPVFDRLGYLGTSSIYQLPHVTWCTTGPLAFLPLHAAGIYGSDQPEQKVYNYAISSYTPTVSSLLVPPRHQEDFRGILAVEQAVTPGMSSLPFAAEELKRIQKIAGRLPLEKMSGSEATVDAVPSAMEGCSWVHFACHAAQDPQEPTESAFYLYEGKLDLAKISKKPLKHASLAFLSACQTASGNKDLPEEAIHLAAGMIAAGYPTVIATMWSIKVQYAPLIAELVYTQLLRDGVPSTKGAAGALHAAVAQLRQDVGEENIEDWAPFVHIGI